MKPLSPDTSVSSASAPSRCRVGLHYYQRPGPYDPSSSALAGALAIYLEGRSEEDVPRMLFGLSILRSATAEQVHAAVAAHNTAEPAHAASAGTLFATESPLARADESSADPKPRPVRTLDRYGAACRCLLRLWENEGNPSLSDAEFLHRFEARFPHWLMRPGELDDDDFALVAAELGFTVESDATHDYDVVDEAHRAGRAVIIRTGQTPLQQDQSPTGRPHFLVLERIDAGGFVAWCPFESGASDLLPRADRQWWHRWNATAWILRAGAAPIGA